MGLGKFPLRLPLCAFRPSFPIEAINQAAGGQPFRMSASNLISFYRHLLVLAKGPIYEVESVKNVQMVQVVRNAAVVSFVRKNLHLPSFS